MPQYTFTGSAPWGHGRQELLRCTAVDERTARLALRAHYPGWTVSEQAVKPRDADRHAGGLDATDLTSAGLAYLERLADGPEPPRARGGSAVQSDETPGRKSWGTVPSK